MLTLPSQNVTGTQDAVYLRAEVEHSRKIAEEKRAIDEARAINEAAQGAIEQFTNPN